MSDERVVVRFNAPWTKYFGGDVASFEPHVARKLIKMKHDGKPLVRVLRGGDFMDRAAVTKAVEPTMAPAAPVGGEPDVAPVEEDSEEVVSSPKGRKRKRS